MKNVLLLLMVMMAAAISCNSKVSEEFDTPQLRSLGLKAETWQQAVIATWAVENLSQDGNLELIVIALIPEPMAYDFNDNGVTEIYDARLTFVFGEEGYVHTYYMPMYRNDAGDYMPSAALGTGIKCVGKNCSACKLRGPLRNDAYCDCTRQSNPDGEPMECNMEVSIGFHVLSGPELEIWTVSNKFSYMP